MGSEGLVGHGMKARLVPMSLVQGRIWEEAWLQGSEGREESRARGMCSSPPAGTWWVTWALGRRCQVQAYWSGPAQGTSGKSLCPSEPQSALCWAGRCEEPADVDVNPRFSAHGKPSAARARVRPLPLAVLRVHRLAYRASQPRRPAPGPG